MWRACTLFRPALSSLENHSPVHELFNSDQVAKGPSAERPRSLPPLSAGIDSILEGSTEFR